MKNAGQLYLETEAKVINLMLRYQEVTGELREGGVGPAFFDPKHRQLVQAIYYTHATSDGKRLLTDEHFRSILLAQGGKGDITTAMQVYHECMHGVHHSNSKDDLDLLKSQLINMFVHKEGVRALQDFNDNVKKSGGSYLGSTKQYAEDLQDIVNFTDTKQSQFMNVDEIQDKFISRLEAKRDSTEKMVVCGIREIDEAMNVGFKPGHTTLFIAPTGGHKTNIMINIALGIHARGHNVLFVPLEMDWEDFVGRLVSNVADISYSHILNPQQLLDKDMEKIRKSTLWLKEQHKFSVLDVDEQISVASLRNEIDKRKDFFAPDVVVIDYLGLVKTGRPMGGRHDLTLGEISKDLKFAGRKYGFHIITAAQMGRADIRRIREEGADATIDSTAVKDSQEVAANAEFIFALTQIPDETDRLRLHKVKSRYGRAGNTEMLGLIADRCRITSTALNPSADLGEDVTSGMGIFNDEFENQTPEEASAQLQELADVDFPSLESLDDIDVWEA